MDGEPRHNGEYCREVMGEVKRSKWRGGALKMGAKEGEDVESCRRD